jgi:hypothetical protein
MNDLTETKETLIKANIHDKVIELKKDIERSFIKMGGMLKLIRDNKLYLEKGCVTFEEYIAIPELALNRSTVYAIINVFETFFEKDQKSNQSDIEELVEIGYSKLARISQFKDSEDFEEWIYKAKTLSLSDLGAEIKEAKGIEEKVKEAKIETITCPYCGRQFERKS